MEGRSHPPAPCRELPGGPDASVRHRRASNIDTQKGRADWFTGDVYIDAVAAPAGTSTFAAALVHYTPSAQTVWHTHLHVPDDLRHRGRPAWCQGEGAPIEFIRPGDRVRFEPGENHR